jgi:glutamyl-tRNA reductase
MSWRRSCGKSLGTLPECVLISTCNRVEIVGAAFDVQAASQTASDYFAKRAASDEVAAHLYRKVGDEAVRHLFRVTAGLEAMAVGEPQILGQVKEAFMAAQAAGTVGPLLSRCFERAFAVAKRVRYETDIAHGRVSISSIACELAEQILGDLTGRKVLLVGAGKMSLESARTLTGHGAELLVVNRSVERARELAALSGAHPQLLESLSEALVRADVVISSTSHPSFVLTLDILKRAIARRQGRRLFIIDIAVPRDVDPQVAALEGVFLYNIDDLQGVSKSNLIGRESEVPAAEQIIDAALIQFRKWRGTLQLTPTIVALRERFHSVANEERDRTLARMGSLSDKDRRAIDTMCDLIVNKLLHQPLTELKRGCDGSDQSDLLEVVQRLFKLSVNDSADEPGICDPTDVVALTATREDETPVAEGKGVAAQMGNSPLEAPAERNPARLHKRRA